MHCYPYTEKCLYASRPVHLHLAGLDQWEGASVKGCVGRGHNTERERDTHTHTHNKSTRFLALPCIHNLLIEETHTVAQRQRKTTAQRRRESLGKGV